jgi:hypothetical protein
MAERSRITITATVREALEAARIKSGRSLGEEVEARLRDSLDRTDGDGFLLLRLDTGLNDWLRAFVAGPGFFGTVEQTAIYLLRSHLIKMMETDIWFAGTVPFLSPPTREANERSPQYRRIVRDLDRDG